MWAFSASTPVCLYPNTRSIQWCRLADTYSLSRARRCHLRRRTMWGEGGKVRPGLCGPKVLHTAKPQVWHKEHHSGVQRTKRSQRRCQLRRKAHPVGSASKKGTSHNGTRARGGARGEGADRTATREDSIISLPEKHTHMKLTGINGKIAYPKEGGPRHPRVLHCLACSREEAAPCLGGTWACGRTLE